MDLDVGLSSRKMVECRICHDEDDESNLETPCACCGSLKYAHRQCVQRWCIEKGDTVCEICLQQFKPGYTAPPPLFHFGVVPFHLRGNWEIPRRDHHSHFISMLASEHNYSESSFDDFTTSAPRSITCYQIVATIFLVLLVLRHTLPIIINGAGEYSFTLYMLLMLRTIGILLPIFVMLRLFTAIHHRRRRQQAVDNLHIPTSEEENEPSEAPLRFIRVQ